MTATLLAPDFVAVVLAAGESSRLGQAKQLLRVNGETLLARAVRLANQAGAKDSFVVLGYQAEQMRAAIEGANANIAINSQWSTGMASSVRLGVETVLRVAPTPPNLLLMVCDQPLLDAPFLRNLAEIHKQGDFAVTASRYAEKLGVPAMFRADLYPELLQLRGDHGARDVIRNHKEAIGVVDFPGGEADVDTLEDLQQLIAADKT